MRIAAVIVAAGRGKRFEESIKKQFFPLKGKPIIVWTLEVFDRQERIDELILVIEKEDKGFVIEEILNKYHFKKDIRLAEGGKMRQDSVYSGIVSTSEDIDIVLIHDGVRPLIRSDIIEKVIEETIKEGAVIVAVKESDTTVLSKESFIESFLDRDSIYRVQTPQSFRRGLIMKGLTQAYKDNFYGTDDSSLVIRLGEKVKIVEGTPYNIKITSRDDIYFAERILEDLGD